MAWKTLVAAVPLTLMALSCDRPRSAAESHQAHTFPAEDGKLVRIEPRSLDVVVNVADVGEITVTVDLEARASSAAHARRWLERHQPTFDDDAGKLAVRVPRDRGATVFVGWFHAKGALTFTIPASCRLEVKSSSGDVTIDGEAVLAKEARIETSSGDAEVRGGVRELIFHASSGDLEVADPLLALLDAQTSSGDVAVRSGCARTLVETSSGDVRLQGLTGELSVITGSGDVRSTFESLAAGTPVRVRTSSGDVNLFFPDVPLAGEVRTSSGHIRSRFDGTWDRRKRHLDLGTGTDAAALEIRTVSGEIVLSRSF